jgi:hypothetical protein
MELEAHEARVLLRGLIDAFDARGPKTREA